MQWWCVAQGTAWEWSWQWYPGVWIFVALVSVIYLRGHDAVSSGREAPGGPGRARFFVGLAGLVMLWLAVDWPLGPLGAGYLASAHMVQYMVIAVAAPALLLLGRAPPAGARQGVTGPATRWTRVLSRPVPALIVFLLVTVVTHVPWVVDSLMGTQVGNLLIDCAWFLSGLYFWWPVVMPSPADRPFPPLLQMVYLFPVVLIHTAIAVYLVFSRFPLYATYELAPPTGWLSAVADQQVAGGIMWVTGMPIMLGVVGHLFRRWAAEDGAPDAS